MTNAAAGFICVIKPKVEPPFEGVYLGQFRGVHFFRTLPFTEFDSSVFHRMMIDGEVDFIEPIIEMTGELTEARYHVALRKRLST